jgi:hypothetical protein
MAAKTVSAPPRSPTDHDRPMRVFVKEGSNHIHTFFPARSAQDHNCALDGISRAVSDLVDVLKTEIAKTGETQVGAHSLI